MWHPETELSALLRGELSGPAYDRVTQHVAGCAECRSVRDDLQTILRDLGRTVPSPPTVAWARYRAELHEKRVARAGQRRSAWWRWPAPLALATGLAAVLVFLALEGGRAPYTKNAATFDEAAIGRRLELLRDYRVVERLDLLEDWEILRNLDGPTGQREG
jgi:hypothetical protein